MNYLFYKKQKLKKINKFSKILYLIIPLLFIFMLIYFLFLPKEINLIAGVEHRVDFNIPFVGKINEDATVFSVNNVPLEDNEAINLNEPFYIKSDFAGNHSMTLSIFGIPIKNITVSVLPNQKLVPSGASIGVRINTEGVMVLGVSSFVGEDNEEYAPAENILKAGDMILKVNDTEIDSKETLINCIENNSLLNLEIKRNEDILNVSITPAKAADGKNKIGVWVRDSTQGIGTLTYYNPETKQFGALGHAILDVDTQKIMSVKDGKIMEATILDTKKSEEGSPGELIGEIKSDTSIGNIYLNCETGIYGEITDESVFDGQKALEIGLKDEVQLGKATILANIDGDKIEEFEIEIVSINKYNLNNSKSMVIKITDEDLLSRTNGIVQGMSGSPIIQNGKIIGALTHVFVNDPSKGYAIFIENMLNNSIE